MAIKLKNNGSNIKIISKMDSAIPEDLTSEEWQLYQNSLDEKHLRLTAIPTYFVMKRTLNFGAQQNIANIQVKVGADGKPQIQLGYMLEEVRCALVNIENPAYVPEDEQIKFTKDADGYASLDLIAQLNAVGIVSELFAIRNSIISKEFTPTKK